MAGQLPDPAFGPESTILHASAVTRDDRALLILGPSGSGKSSLALQLIALGATLVADDRTRLNRSGDKLTAGPAPNLSGLIEARHMGILTLPFRAPADVTMAVDLSETETDRLPYLRQINLLGLDIPLYRRIEGPHFASALILSLTGYRTVL